VTRVADLSVDHPVWTALAVAPNGAVYAGTLTPAPHTEGSSRVVRITADGEVNDVWTGLTTVTGLAFGPDGSLYALEMATSITPEGGMPPGTGRLVRQTGPDSHEDILTGLEYPIALELGPDGGLSIALPAYGANDQAGAIISVDLDHPRPMVMDEMLLAGARCPGARIYAATRPDATPESLAGGHNHTATPVAVPGDANAPGAQTVQIRDYAFDPPTLTLPLGATVTWINDDAVAHTATARDRSFDTGNIGPGERVSLTFTTAGSFAYICLYHPNMAGTVVVT
jgi:plastocyanin